MKPKAAKKESPKKPPPPAPPAKAAPQASQPPQPITTGEAAERAAVAKIKAKARATGIASLSTREAKRLDRYERAIETRLRAKALRSCTQKELVELLASPRKVLLDWERDGMPRGGDRRYNLHQVIPWLKERWLEQAKSHGASPAEAEWDLRFKRARTLRAEREEKASEGRLLDRETVEEEAAACVRTLRARLEVLGSRVAPLCEGLEARGIAGVVDREVRVFLEDLARGMAALVPAKRD